jgi:hypothetical protein
MTYTKSYAQGFQDGSKGRTPLTADVLNNMDLGVQSANDIFQTVLNSGSRPTGRVLPGAIVYNKALGELEIYQNESWQSIAMAGSVVQTVYVRSDNRATYSALNSGDGSTITDLSITITPRYKESWILCRWMINGEVHQDTSFLVHQDGSLASPLTLANYPPGWQNRAGYNTVEGNNRWSCMFTGNYDRDESSTPSNYEMLWIDTANGSTTTRVYSPAIRSSSAGVFTLALNRTLGSTGADNHEMTVSMGFAMEIRRFSNTIA